MLFHECGHHLQELSIGQVFLVLVPAKLQRSLDLSGTLGADEQVFQIWLLLPVSNKDLK